MTYYTRHDLETRLCRWMLAMSPAQRLDFGGECAGAVMEYRGENYGRDLPEPFASQKNANELRLLKVALEEKRRREGIIPRPTPPRIENEKN
jgi:hypothetical protein